MSRPFRIVDTKYSRFRSATCRLFRCRLRPAVPPTVLYMNGVPLTMGGEYITMQYP